MCGIIGAVAERNVIDILLEGLSRMEYRGYDSAGVALITPESNLSVLKSTGNVGKLKSVIGDTASLEGSTGIAHTRWATHGKVTTDNAHPHISNGRFAVVHNGIIENHKLLRASLINNGYIFSSDTDTEVIAHTIAQKVEQGMSLLPALQSAVKDFDGAYGTVVMDKMDPSRFVVARSGSPLVIGLGIGENFIASDQMALFPVTRKFMYLEEGDVAEVTRHSVTVYNESGEKVQRNVVEASAEQDAADKSGYRHYMMKEMQEQPVVIRNTLKDRLSESGDVLPNIFGENSDALLAKVKHVKIVACGTSYHAGMVAQYWLEQYANVSCSVEIASEFRYRKSVVQKDSLFVTISQSGETADTLAALRLSKTLGYMSSLAICNVPGSSLVRESEMSFMTNAGVEIGVASTKAFTTQLTAFLMMTLSLGRFNGIEDKIKDSIIEGLRSLPSKIEQALNSADVIKELAEEFSDKHNCLFLGRGDQYPIAMEGALKLKEISYIHAEAYASGELKHGPLALIDDDMPVVVVAPNNELIEKLHSNIEEVRARGGIMYVFADKESAFKNDPTMSVVDLPHCEAPIAPIVYTIPLQLLSYYVALIKGTDVDQPRNLAKSVSVE
jgi:glucosamine--fructose-6-phosphate aminotransferase (isomerizing)